MIVLKVPFRKRWRYKERELFFCFNIGALEYATKDVLKIDLWQITEYLENKDNFNSKYDLNVGILYGGYLMACLKLGQIPKYKIGHAAGWAEYMSKSESEKFATELGRLFGEMGEAGEKKKKKK